MQRFDSTPSPKKASRPLAFFLIRTSKLNCCFFYKERLQDQFFIVGVAGVGQPVDLVFR